MRQEGRTIAPHGVKTGSDSTQDWAKAQGHGGDRKNNQAVILPLETVADRSAQSGASDKTQRMADQVAKASPALARQVAHGEKSLPEAVEELTGKRPGAKKPAATPDPTEAPYDPREDEAAEMAHTVRTLAAENDALKDRIACEVMPFSEEEKTVALETLGQLRAEILRLEIENRALVSSRDSYMRDNAELKNQCAIQRRQIEKLQKAAS
jgi:hypothetical protein